MEHEQDQEKATVEERCEARRKDLVAIVVVADNTASTIDRLSREMAAAIEDLRGLHREHGQMVGRFQEDGGDSDSLEESARWAVRMEPFIRWRFGTAGGGLLVRQGKPSRGLFGSPGVRTKDTSRAKRQEQDTR